MMREYAHEAVERDEEEAVTAGDPNQTISSSSSSSILPKKPAAPVMIASVIDPNQKGHGGGSSSHHHHRGGTHHSPSHHHPHHHHHPTSSSSSSSRCCSHSHPLLLLRVLAEVGVAFFAVLSVMQSANVSCPVFFSSGSSSSSSYADDTIAWDAALRRQRTPSAIIGTMNATTTTTTRRDRSSSIQFLRPRAPPGQADAYSQTWFKEAYSGMWWQTRQQFAATDWEAGFASMPITASLKALRGGRARQTRDWLDLAVEHLSVVWKHFDHQPDPANDAGAYRTIEEKLREYSHRTLTSATGIKADLPAGSAAPATLALLPFAGQRHKKDSALREGALTATLASLWQIGVRRAVVVGRTDGEAEMVRAAFAALRLPTVQSQSPSPSSSAANFFSENPMELHFLQIRNVTEEEAKLMPKVALRGLQAAMKKADRGTVDDEVIEWLGEQWQSPEDSSNLKDVNIKLSSSTTATTATRFRYIYFTEPDLILHTRPSAMDAIRREMDRGGVFSAHRFMPLPHQRSFPAYTNLQKVLPDVGRFAAIDDLDAAADSCCDAGGYYPSNPTDPVEPVASFPCGPYLPWWRCGYFHKNVTAAGNDRIAAVAKLHHRVPQPLVSLVSGTGFPLIHNNQRVCFPSRLGACDGDPQQPSKRQ